MGWARGRGKKNVGGVLVVGLRVWTGMLAAGFVVVRGGTLGREGALCLVVYSIVFLLI